MKNFKIMLISMLALSLLLPISVKASGIVNIATYHAWAFTGRSTPQYIELQEDTNFVSVVGYCKEEGATDQLICHIQATDDSGFRLDIPFTADKVVESFTFHVPKGEYKVNIGGSSSIQKTDAIVVFSVTD